MRKYIECEAVKALIKAECSPKVAAYLIDAVATIPAADVRPVVRGKWTMEHLASTSGGTYAVVRCSECKAQYPIWPTNFCPNCGADMREES